MDCGWISIAFFAVQRASIPQRANGGFFIKLRIRYDETVQTLDLDEKTTEQLWVSLSLEGEGLSDSEREQKIQAAFDIQYNRPEYNSWHKFDRQLCINALKGCL